MFKPNDKVIPISCEIISVEMSIKCEVKKKTICTVIDKEPNLKIDGYDFVVIRDEFGYVFDWPTKYLEHYE